MKSLRVLCIGDPHIRETDVSRVHKMVSEILRIAQETQPDLIVNLGDTLHKHGKDGLDPLFQAVSFLKALSEIAPTHVLIGNHDRKTNQEFLTEVHPFIGISNTDRLFIHWKVNRIEFEDFSFLFVPYVFKGRVHEAIQTEMTLETFSDEIDVSFLHAEIRGCKMDSGTSSKDGDNWYPNFPLGISGHIHRRGQVGDNFLYPGTAIQQKRDDNADRSLSLYTFYKDSIPKKCPVVKKIGYEEERHFLDVISLLNFRLTPSEFRSFVLPKNSKVWITLIGTREELDSVSSIKKNKLKEQGVTIVDQVLVPELENTISIEEGFEKLYMESLTKKEKRLLNKFL